MAKKTVKKRKNPPDTTLRNTARKADIHRLTKMIDGLDKVVSTWSGTLSVLIDRIEALEDKIRELETVNASN